MTSAGHLRTVAAFSHSFWSHLNRSGFFPGVRCSIDGRVFNSSRCGLLPSSWIGPCRATRVTRASSRWRLCARLLLSHRLRLRCFYAVFYRRPASQLEWWLQTDFLCLALQFELTRKQERDLCRGMACYQELSAWLRRLIDHLAVVLKSKRHPLHQWRRCLWLVSFGLSIV